MADVLVSPLASRSAALASVAATTEGAVRIDEAVSLAQVDLRLAPSEIGRVSFPLPLEPNTFVGEDTMEALWLGPDEWLVVGPPGTVAATIERFERALDGVHHSVVDVSANRAVIDLGGPRRRELLESGCGIDLHPGVWSQGRCAQTLLAHVPVILQERADSTRVFVRPSLANSLADWLIDAARDL